MQPDRRRQAKIYIHAYTVVISSWWRVAHRVNVSHIWLMESFVKCPNMKPATYSPFKIRKRQRIRFNGTPICCYWRPVSLLSFCQREVTLELSFKEVCYTSNNYSCGGFSSILAAWNILYKYYATLTNLYRNFLFWYMK